MKIEIVEASKDDVLEVTGLVAALLMELEPESRDEVVSMPLMAIASNLFEARKIYAFLAIDEGAPIGVITLHECAAIYAGGLFGEISEMYVKPEYRSGAIGKLLIQASIKKAQELNWQRIEVGTPPPETSKKTVRFYENNNFKATGTRLKLLIESKP
jgi:GNAT superfamily N-acetyltransferase